MSAGHIRGYKMIWINELVNTFDDVLSIDTEVISSDALIDFDM